MRKLTEQQALKQTIKMWKWMAKTGGEKWEYFKEGVNHPSRDCFLCEFDRQQSDDCESCPYHKRFGHCTSTGHPYLDYTMSLGLSSESQKRWASKCLKQLESLEVSNG